MEDGRVLGSRSKNRTDAGSRRAVPVGISNDRPPLIELSDGEQHPEIKPFKIGVLNIPGIEE